MTGASYRLQTISLCFTILIDYLSVLYHTDRPLSDGEARDLLYKTVHDVCTEDSDYPQLSRYAYAGKDFIIGPILFQVVNLAVYYLRKMDLTDVVHQFEIWNEGVQRAVFNSPEFKKIVALDDKYKTEAFCIDNILTPHEWFKENAISEEENTLSKPIYSEPTDPAAFKGLTADITWNIKKSELPFEPETKDTILPF